MEYLVDLGPLRTDLTRSSLLEDYPDDDHLEIPAYDPFLHAAVFSLHSMSPSLPTSASNATTLPDYDVDQGKDGSKASKKRSPAS